MDEKWVKKDENDENIVIKFPVKSDVTEKSKSAENMNRKRWKESRENIECNCTRKRFCD